MNDFPIGTRVTYDDENPLTTDVRGTIAEPTADELAHVKTYSDPVGPEHGDVLVHWDGDEDWDRSWNYPDHLQALPVVSTEGES